MFFELIYFFCLDELNKLFDKDIATHAIVDEDEVLQENQKKAILLYNILVNGSLEQKRSTHLKNIYEYN